MKTFLLLAAMAAALAACGSSDSGGSVAGTTATGASNGGSGSAGAGAAAGSDTFLARVLAVIGNTSDTAEPEAIDAVQPTTPKNAEPAPIS